MSARIRYLLTETALWVLAALGGVAIVLVIAAYLFNTSLILFRTGSMEPTIPAGSAALVQEVEASTVEVGDVLTVDRPGQLPVTHRVTSVEPGSHAAERVITMRGDANETDDPAPYVITDARQTLWSVPGLANSINRMGDPAVLGGITMAASLLVGWAFWPHQSPQRGRTHEEKSNLQDMDPVSSSAVMRHAHAGSRASILEKNLLRGIPLTALLGMAYATGTAADPPESDENIVVETSHSRFITMESQFIPEDRLNMAPGDSSRWDIAVSAGPPDPGEVQIGISLEGDFPKLLNAYSCTDPLSNGPGSEASPQESCPGKLETLLRDEEVQDVEGIIWLESFPTAEDRWIRIDSTVPAGDVVSPNAASIVRVHASLSSERSGDSLESDPAERDFLTQAPGTDSDIESGSDSGAESAESPSGSALAETGFSLLAGVGLALVLIAGGVAAHRIAKNHRPKHDEGSP